MTDQITTRLWAEIRGHRGRHRRRRPSRTKGESPLHRLAEKRPEIRLVPRSERPVRVHAGRRHGHQRMGRRRRRDEGRREAEADHPAGPRLRRSRSRRRDTAERRADLRGGAAGLRESCNRALELRTSKLLVSGFRSTRYCTQSAIKTFVSPSDFAFRFDPNTSCFPSGENIGKPSKVALNVTCSRPVPSRLTKKMSKSRPFGILDVRREDDPLAVGMPRRREVGAAELRHLAQVAAVAVHHENLERRRPPQLLLQQSSDNRRAPSVR